MRLVNTEKQAQIIKDITIIGKADVKGKSVNLYVLKGIRLESIIK